MKNYISLGAGVQSSTMALMAAAGEIEPMPDGAIFADTQAEPKKVYEWLDWLEKQLPFPVHRVTAGNLREEATTLRKSKSGNWYFRSRIPFITIDGEGRISKNTRHCTADFKITPIVQVLKKLAGVPRGCKEKRVCSWIGISLDEMQRMKPAREPWVECIWPLVERRITRAACLDWMRAKGYPEPPRSACTFCPFHSDAEWRRLKTEDPESFADAVDVERTLQAKAPESVLNGTPYLHDSLKPLDEVDFRNDVDRGQLTMGWLDECEGMCGV